MSKLNKILKTIILIELAIAIPVVVGIYAWGMLGFPPDNANKCTTVGKFDETIDITDTNGNTERHYHFKSNDNEVWWLLTESEIGFVPNENTEYMLTYDNKGTTKANKPCDCAPEFECECEVYDDEFVSIREMK